MRLGRLFGVMFGMGMVGMSEMGVMAGILVRTVFVMLGRLLMMLGRFLVMMGGFSVMFGSAFGVRHGYLLALRRIWRRRDMQGQ